MAIKDVALHAYILLWWLVIQCIKITIINVVVKIINLFFITKKHKQETSYNAGCLLPLIRGKTEGHAA